METHLSKLGAEELLPVGPFAGANPPMIIEEEVEEEVPPDGDLGNDKTPSDGVVATDVDVEGGPVKLGNTYIPAIKFENPTTKFVT